MEKTKQAKMKIWNLIFTIFYYSTLFISVWAITQINWSNLESLEVIKNVGWIGGLMYFGEFFKKESKKGEFKDE